MQLDAAMLVRLLRQMITDNSQGGRYQPGCGCRSSSTPWWPDASATSVTTGRPDGRRPALLHRVPPPLHTQPSAHTGRRVLDAVPRHRTEARSHRHPPRPATSMSARRATSAPTPAARSSTCASTGPLAAPSRALAELVQSNVPALATFGAFDLDGRSRRSTGGPRRPWAADRSGRPGRYAQCLVSHRMHARPPPSMDRCPHAQPRRNSVPRGPDNSLAVEGDHSYKSGSGSPAVTLATASLLGVGEICAVRTSQQRPLDKHRTDKI